MTDAAGPGFSRSMQMVGCLLITLSCVTPASTVFIVMPELVQQTGSAALICALVGGVISLLVAFVYAELGSAFPLTGGEYAMVGRTMGPLAGFLILGLNLVVLMMGIAVIALGLGTYVQVLLPGTSALADALICLGLTTICALLSVRTNALITGTFLALELLALAVVSVLGFADPAHNISSFTTDLVVVNAAGLFEPVSTSDFGLGISAAIFAFYGFGSAVYLGEETHSAPRHIARAILWALAIAFVSITLPLAAMLIGAPRDAGLLSSDTMFADFVLGRGGPTLALAMNLTVALAIINAAIAIVILASRMLYSTGRDKVWPAFVNDALVKIDARHKSPWVATLATGALAGLLCLVKFEMLLVASGTALMVVYGSLCVAVLVGRRNGSTAHAEYRMPFFPWPPILALAAFAYVILSNVTDPETGQASFIATAVLLAVSATYYLLVLRRRGEWVLRGPGDETGV